MAALRSQVSGQINVEVDSQPGVDLNAIIAEIREQYETTTKKNQKDLQNWFNQKVRVDRRAVCDDCQQIYVALTFSFKVTRTKV